MSPAAVWLGGVALVLTGLAAIGWLWSTSLLPPAAFTAQAILCGSAALAMQLRHRTERPLFVPDASYATLALGIGAAMVLNGLAFGRWLVLIGAGVTAIAVGGLLRERAGRRRMAR